MTPHVLTAAADLLRQHYGPIRSEGPAAEWNTLVRLVLEHGRPAKRIRDWSWLDDSPLRTAPETLATGVHWLAEILEVNHQKPKLAPPLTGCAKWWQQHFGAADTPADFAHRSIESWQTELRAIAGVNWELADRILLVVGRQTVYPLNRGSLRIAARHGWVEASADYDEWQSFFTAAARDGNVSLLELADWNARVGHDYCRSEPHCDECPLKSLLPAHGPVPLEAE